MFSENWFPKTICLESYSYNAKFVINLNATLSELINAELILAELIIADLPLKRKNKFCKLFIFGQSAKINSAKVNKNCQSAETYF